MDSFRPSDDSCRRHRMDAWLVGHTAWPTPHLPRRATRLPAHRCAAHGSVRRSHLAFLACTGKLDYHHHYNRLCCYWWIPAPHVHMVRLLGTLPASNPRNGQRCQFRRGHVTNPPGFTHPPGHHRTASHASCSHRRITRFNLFASQRCFLREMSLPYQELILAKHR